MLHLLELEWKARITYSILGCNPLCYILNLSKKRRAVSSDYENSSTNLFKKGLILLRYYWAKEKWHKGTYSTWFHFYSSKNRWNYFVYECNPMKFNTKTAKDISIIKPTHKKSFFFWEVLIWNKILCW